MQKKGGKYMKSKETPKDRSQYWSEYWGKNRDDILKRRRDRYNSDPEYKKRMQEIRKRNYEKNKVLKVKKPESDFVSIRSKPIILELNGQKMLMYDIEYFAKKIGRSVATVRYWERKGILPKTPYKGSRKCLYSKEMIKAVYNALEEQGFPGNIDLEDFSDYVYACWQSLEVI